MPLSMSVGIGELSWTPAAPSTETWTWVIGNPDFSNAGNSEPFAETPPSTTTAVLVIERSLRMLSPLVEREAVRSRLPWLALGLASPACNRRRVHLGQPAVDERALRRVTSRNFRM